MRQQRERREHRWAVSNTANFTSQISGGPVSYHGGQSATKGSSQIPWGPVRFPWIRSDKHVGADLAIYVFWLRLIEGVTVAEEHNTGRHQSQQVGQFHSVHWTDHICHCDTCSQEELRNSSLTTKYKSRLNWNSRFTSLRYRAQTLSLSNSFWLETCLHWNIFNLPAWHQIRYESGEGNQFYFKWWICWEFQTECRQYPLHYPYTLQPPTSHFSM